jgi:signal peptidase I
MHINSYKKCIAPLILGFILSGGLIFVKRQFIYNPSISLIKGYYFTYPIIELKPHDIVLLCVWDESRAEVLHQLGLPYKSGECLHNTPYLMKQIVAKEGDEVSIAEDGVRVNNYLYKNSRLVQKSRQINLLPIGFGRFKLKHNEYFVLGVTPHSYDSRYFGVINREQIYRGAKLIYPIDHMLW